MKRREAGRISGDMIDSFGGLLICLLRGPWARIVKGMDRLRVLAFSSLVMAWAVLVCLPETTAQPLQLELSSQSSGITRFTATGAQGPNVNLQGSFDLESWFVIGSAPAVNGQAELAHTNSEPVDAWFYRAVAAPAVVQINAGPQADTNRTAG